METNDGCLNNEQELIISTKLISMNNMSKNNEKHISTCLTDEDVLIINNLARDENLFDRIVLSIAPSIYGRQDIKQIIALYLFGGVTKTTEQKISGDINVLLCGDIATGKSEFLKFVDRFNSENKRHTDIRARLFDDFHLMKKEDCISNLERNSGIIATVTPKRGRYNTNRQFLDNVNLSSIILSKFDVVCVMHDIVDSIEDLMIAEFILDKYSNNIRNRNIDGLQPIPLGLLKKFIIYARERIRPNLSLECKLRLVSAYMDLKRASLEFGAVNLTIRLFESMIRLSEANAKLHLRQVVNEHDVNTAIRISFQTFILIQIPSVASQLENKLLNYLSYKKSNYGLLMELLKQLYRDTLSTDIVNVANEERIIEIPETLLLEKAETLNIHSIKDFLNSSAFKENGFCYKAEKGIIGHIF